MHHVMFVHGIGTHGKSWIDDEDNGTTLRERLAASWGAVGGSEADFKKLLDLVPIRYDDKFDELYKKWGSEVETLRGHLKGFAGAEATLGPLLDSIEKPGSGVSKQKFFYTHALDLLWYWANSILRDRIVVRAATQVLDCIEEHFGPMSEAFSLVGHSMGTSVVHKLIQHLYREPRYQKLMERGFRFRVVMQISNVSFALSDDRDRHYANEVRPSVVAGQGCCDIFINASNKFDLISEVWPFAPTLETWLDRKSHIEAQSIYFPRRTADVTSRNVHSICHYFENPAVYIPFFEAVIEQRLEQADKDAAIKAFESRTVAGQFKGLKDQLAKLRESVGPNGADYIRASIDYVQYLRTLS